MIVRRILVVIAGCNFITGCCRLIRCYSDMVMLNCNVFIWHFDSVIRTWHSLILRFTRIFVFPTTWNGRSCRLIGLTGCCTVWNRFAVRLFSWLTVIALIVNDLGFILSFVTNTVINVITLICSLFKNFDIGSIFSGYSRIYKVFMSLVAINLNDFDGFEINYTINNYVIVLFRSIKLPIRSFYIC